MTIEDILNHILSCFQIKIHRAATVVSCFVMTKIV